MMKTDIYNKENKSIGTMNLPEEVFGRPWNKFLVEQALTAQMNNRRRPWAHALGRGEVRGGGRKPWRQKGTGRARHGSIRSPLWRGGGKAHGPRSERDYSQKINKKMRRLAIFSVLSKKLKDQNLRIIDDLAMETPKTKTLAAFLNFYKENSKKRNFDILLIPAVPRTDLARAASSINKVKVLPATSLNVYDLLNHKNILIEGKAIPAIKERYGLKGQKAKGKGQK